MALVDKTALIGLESLVELVSLIMSFAVGYTAYRIYKITGEKLYLHFSLAFIFITLGFLVRAFINAGVYFGRKDVIEIAINTPVLTVHKALSLVYLMLMISAYLILIIITFRIQDAHLVSMMGLFAIVAVIASYYKFIIFPILSFLLLLYLVAHYYHGWSQKHTKYQLRTLWGFMIICLAQLLFPLVYLGSRYAFEGQEFFVAGTVIQCIGYGVLLWSLITVLRK